MIKNIMAVLLAFILALSVCIFGFKSFIGIDVFQLWNKYESSINTEQEPIETELVKMPDIEAIDLQPCQQVDKGRRQDKKEFSSEEVAVVKKYVNSFAALEKEYEGKIDDLIQKAIAEYKGLSKQEKENAMFTLGLKYVNLVAALEKECDDSFNKILEEMKYELEENDFTTDILIDLKNQYQEGKNQRREFFIEKFLE